jgi:acetoin utilization deacetylase AcuC-like enzyme
MAAEKAYDGPPPAFAVIRPPEHHASADSCWGFCYFNSVAISLLEGGYNRKVIGLNTDSFCEGFA